MDTTNRTADSPPPVFPTLPTTTAKNVTRALALASILLTGVGTWYAKEIETDPETAQVIAEKVNVPGLLSAATGIIGIVGTLFLQKQHTDQAEAAVAQVAAAKNVEVDKAAAAPPVDKDGNTSVKNTLNAALTQASQQRDFDTAAKVLELLKTLREDAVGHLENVA